MTSAKISLISKFILIQKYYDIGKLNCSPLNDDEYIWKKLTF